MKLMKAMQLHAVSSFAENTSPLQPAEQEIPVPPSGYLRLKVRACGVCHTELDEIEGRTSPPSFPVIPGHQVIGEVDALGPGSKRHQVGDRLGVGWFYSSCGRCSYCRSGAENLCRAFAATGRDADGGYAEYMIIPEASAYRVPENIDDAHAAPLLCAGAVGHRSLQLAHITDGDILGFMGFGASAHLLLQTVRQTLPAVKCFVFARSRNQREFARDLGAAWTGTIEESPPEPLNAIIDTTPVWKPVIESMAKLAPGGRLVINAIRKIDADKRYLLNTTYHDHLWLEKEIKTTANVTRKDISEFLNLAGQITINVEVQTYALEKANEALSDLHKGSGKGARVLVIE